MKNFAKTVKNLDGTSFKKLDKFKKWYNKYNKRKRGIRND